jgi:hypothetical protein
MLACVAAPRAYRRRGSPIHQRCGKSCEGRADPRWHQVRQVVQSGRGPPHCTFTQLVDEAVEIFWGAYLGTADEILIAGPLRQVATRIVEERERARNRKAGSWIPTSCAGVSHLRQWRIDSFGGPPYCQVTRCALWEADANPERSRHCERFHDGS